MPIRNRALLKRGLRFYSKSILLKTGQTTQYDNELDDGYYQLGIAKSYTILTTGAQSGTTNIDLPHLISDSGAFTAANKTYTDAGKCGVFKAAGGETIVITGSALNNGVFTTASATADTVVFVDAIADEADAPMTTFAKRESISNNVVIDNNVSVRANGYPLHWLRYVETTMGVAGGGLMPWTGTIYDIFQYCAFCNAVSLGGFNDWRIPNFFEALNLYDNEPITSMPDSTAFPTWTTLPCWVSSALASSPTRKVSINYSNGGITNNIGTSGANIAILVRG